MKRILAALAVSASAVSVANAESLNDGYVGCLSDEYLDQFIQAQVKGDKQGMDYLFKQQVCVPTSSNFKISVLDRGFVTTKYRVYVGDDAVVLYSPSEAISR